MSWGTLTRDQRNIYYVFYNYTEVVTIHVGGIWLINEQFKCYFHRLSEKYFDHICARTSTTDIWSYSSKISIREWYMPNKFSIFTFINPTVLLLFRSRAHMLNFTSDGISSLCDSCLWNVWCRSGTIGRVVCLSTCKNIYNVLLCSFDQMMFSVTLLHSHA